MDQGRVEYIIKQYLDHAATEGELHELMELLLDETHAAMVQKAFDAVIVETPPADEYHKERWELLYQRVMEKEQPSALPLPNKKVQRINWVQWAAAAVLLLVLGAGVYYYAGQNGARDMAQNDPLESRLQTDVPPGSDKAILTLADGTKITLDSTSGHIAKEGSVTVINRQGDLNYEGSGGNTPTGAVSHHTLSTPRGGKYSLVLADGTKIWLNAASSLRFPTAFAGKDRVVELTGEGYFEVAHNSRKPFHVRVNGMEVQVLGTHFNINSYEDEDAIRTTLLEGSVKVTFPGFSKSTDKSQVLKPGEQAVVKGRDLKVNTAVDTEQVMAWKNNLFVFTGNKIQTVMRQVARWYDVDIRYAGPVTDEDFVGFISRYENISQLLTMMEKTGKVKFEIRGKTITVMNP